jgi:hypothetical protein
MVATPARRGRCLRLRRNRDAGVAMTKELWPTIRPQAFPDDHSDARRGRGGDATRTRRGRDEDAGVLRARAGRRCAAWWRCAGGAPAGDMWRTGDFAWPSTHSPPTISPPGRLAAHWQRLVCGRPAGHPHLAPFGGVAAVRSLQRSAGPEVGSGFSRRGMKNKELRTSRRPRPIRVAPAFGRNRVGLFGSSAGTRGRWDQRMNLLKSSSFTTSSSRSRT